MVNQLHLMTWKEIEAAFANDPVILIPFGSMEEHGPHSISGDYLAAEEIALRAAKETDSYTVPVTAFGYSEYFRGFPGTISFSPRTLMSVADDIIRSLYEHGIRKIFLVNGHAGNSALLDIVARNWLRESKLVMCKVDLWQSIPDELYRKKFGDKQVRGHGAEPLTSVMHYLYPDYMRMDLLGDITNNLKWESFNLQNVSKADINGLSIGIYRNMEDLTRSGVMGDPHAGNSEIGKQYVNHLTNLLVEVINKMKTSNLNLE